jgi:hypothetical protein
VPFHWYLLDRYTQLLREKQKFDVKYPCGEMLGWEDLLSGTTREELKAALGITNVPHAYYS